MCRHRWARVVVAALMVGYVGLGCSGKRSKSLTLEQRIDAGLDRAAAFVIGHQDERGAFISRTYAAFKDGFSLSPLVLTALRFVPSSDGQQASADVQRAYERGVDFLAGLIAQDGVLRNDLDGPSYPTYAIAGAVLVLNVPKNERHERVRQALIRELRARQLTEPRGWSPDDPSYGGWGYFHSIPTKGASRDPLLSANLSATLFAIGALRLAGVAPDDPALVQARVFVERCQNHADTPGTGDDGGFFFSPAIADSNKAGADTTAGHTVYRSYGSMTADGLRALIRLGVPVDHPRVQAARAWLQRHYTPAKNPGVFPPENEIRRESAYYYYIWSSAHALRALGEPRIETEAGGLSWAEALAEELLSRQQVDGSWKNPYSEMREDDPLLATSFAIAGLAIAKMVIQQAYRSHSHDA